MEDEIVISIDKKIKELQDLMLTSDIQFTDNGDNDKWFSLLGQITAYNECRKLINRDNKRINSDLVELRNLFYKLNIDYKLKHNEQETYYVLEVIDLKSDRVEFYFDFTTNEILHDRSRIPNFWYKNEFKQDI